MKTRVSTARLLDNATALLDARVVVKVIEQGRFSVYIYREVGERHHLPHCHVRWSDGSAAIGLRDLALIEGRLPRAAREIIEEHYDELVEVWNRLNTERPV